MADPINQLDDKGRPHGHWEAFHDKGDLWYKTFYVHGKYHGPYELYYSGKILFKKGTFHNNLEHGPWIISWNPQP